MNMNRYVFIKPCGVQDMHTGETEYYETSDEAKVELEKKEDTYCKSPEARMNHMWQCNDEFMEENWNPDIPTLTEAEVNAINDPKPGTDRGWDTATESEKRMFRNPMYGKEMGKTFSDLMKDRDAIDVQARTVRTVKKLEN